MRNHKTLKIMFDLEPILNLLKSFKGDKFGGDENYQSVYKIKENLFIEKTKKNISINFCCLRLFGILS